MPLVFLYGKSSAVRLKRFRTVIASSAILKTFRSNSLITSLSCILKVESLFLSNESGSKSDFFNLNDSLNISSASCLMPFLKFQSSPLSIASKLTFVSHSKRSELSGLSRLRIILSIASLRTISWSSSTV